MSRTDLARVFLPGLEVPLTTAVLGTMTMGDTADPATSREIFEAAMAAGITGVDCANSYAGGATEALIGPWVRKYRADIVLATKAGMPHPDARGLPPLSRPAVLGCVEGSLRRLGVDAIDLFYLHQPDRVTPIEETLRAVGELHRAGKVRALGVSNYSAWRTLEVAETARQLGVPAPVVGQNVYNLLARRLEDEWLEFAAARGVFTMCYNPLAGGLLAGVSRRNGPPLRFGDTSGLAEMYRKRYWVPELLDAARALERLATESGIAPAELGLRWLVSQPGVGAVLLGGDRVAHLSANLRALADGPLSEDVLAACAAITDPLKGAMPAASR